jgi:hypothetical protein
MSFGALDVLYAEAAGRSGISELDCQGTGGKGSYDTAVNQQVRARNEPGGGPEEECRCLSDIVGRAKACRAKCGDHGLHRRNVLSIEFFSPHRGRDNAGTNSVQCGAPMAPGLAFRGNTGDVGALSNAGGVRAAEERSGCRNGNPSSSGVAVLGSSSTTLTKHDTRSKKKAVALAPAWPSRGHVPEAGRLILTTKQRELSRFWRKRCGLALTQLTPATL